MNFKLSALLKLLFVAVMITACGGGGSDVSSTTGWKYNDPDNGGFEVREDAGQETGPGLVLIEGGTFTMGRVEQDLLYDWNNVPRRVTVSSFYMDQTEVKNVDYKEYLHWLKRVFVSYPEVYRQARPDTLVWRRPMAYNEPYVKYYFRHPSYNNYPVVGISWLQATDYCAWRTDRVNEQILIREKILGDDPNQSDDNNFNTDAYFAGQYTGNEIGNLPDLDPNKDTRRVRLDDGILLPRYRLPTEAEWEFAALALIGNSYEERVYERRIYPWDGSVMRQDNQAERGQMRANYARGRGDLMGTAGDLNDNATIPAPVESYWPNDYGLYCMAGNVNEWVQDVYRPLTFEDFDEFNPYRGNVFETLVTDEEGNIAEKDSLGRLKYREISTEEAINRWNYKKADYRNYNDGDYESSIIEGRDWAAGAKSQERGSDRMYVNSVKDQDINSLVSDQARVYKGGSWRDRAYWLSPGTRRYLNEAQSRDDLGFRCAMTRVGSPTGY